MKSTEIQSLSVIVPFYNEEKYLEKSVSRLLEINLFKKIILVNDMSNDNSGEIAKSLSIKFDNILLISLNKRLGKGNAIKVGLNYIDTTHLIVHDADLEYFPSDIPQMFYLAKKNTSSLILGSRTIGNKKTNNKYKLTYFGNKILTKLFSLLNLYKISDIASCYWLIETEILKKLDIKEKGFGIEVEVLSKFICLNNKIIEVPINYDGRLYSEGKKIRIKDGIMIFFKIIKYSKLINTFKFRQMNN